MGLLFGGSTTENQKEIDQLKARVEKAEEIAEDAEERAKKAESNVRQAREHSLKTVEAIHELFAELEDKDGVVEQLDEPRVAWKATNNGICKLILPAGTTVVHPTKDNVHHGGKKRADEAVVAMLYEVKGRHKNKFIADNHTITIDSSKRTSYFRYKIGETVTPNEKLDESLDDECAHGIHFFCTREEALDWY